MVREKGLFFLLFGLVCLSGATFAADKDNDAKEAQPVKEKPVKIKGIVYGGSKLLKGVKLIFVSYENELKLEKIVDDFKDSYSDYSDDYTEYTELKDEYEDKLKAAKKSYKVTQGETSKTLNDLLKKVKSKYDKKLKKAESSAEDGKDEFVKDYAKMIHAVLNAQATGEEGIVVKEITTDHSGRFEMELPTGMYYVLSEEAISFPRSDFEYFYYDTVSILGKEKELKIKINDSKFAFPD